MEVLSYNMLIYRRFMLYNKIYKLCVYTLSFAFNLYICVIYRKFLTLNLLVNTKIFS